MKIDFSKGVSLHRLYGHHVFVKECVKQEKDQRFRATICRSLKCDRQPVRWQQHNNEVPTPPAN